MWKRIFCVLCLVFLSSSTIVADNGDLPFRVYLPVIRGESAMGNWKVIVPEAATNLCTNPSLETNTTGWASTNTLARSNVESFFGAYSAKCTYALGDVDFMTYAIILPTATTTYKINFWVWVASNWDGDDILIQATSFVDSSIVVNNQWTSTDGTETWFHVQATLTVAADVTGDIELITDGLPSNGRFVYIDAVMIEEVTESEYIDGDQPGCSWSGTAHGSTSSRSAMSRARGIVKDLKDDYCFGVSDAIGVGASPISLGVSGYAFLDGGEVSGIKRTPRKFSLVGFIRDQASGCDLHDARQALIKELAFDRYPQDADGWQPVRIRYTGASVDKQISAFYTGGLGANLKVENRIHEKVALQFVAPDPMFYGLGENATALDEAQTLAYRYIVSRLRSTREWDDLSVGAGGGTVTDIVIDADKTLLACGGWATIDGIANTSRIARYSFATDAWTALNNGATDGAIQVMALGADGSLYVGGTFTSMDNGAGAVANTSRIAKWDGANWLALGTGAADNGVYSLAVGDDGTLYAGGTFTAMGGVANTASIAAWDGTNWSSISSGVVGGIPSVSALAYKDGTLVAGGDFTSLNGVTLNRIGYYYNSTWYAMESGAAAGSVSTIHITDNYVYVGGAFTGMGSASIDKIARWNGTSWEALGDGVNNSVHAIVEAPDGLMYVGGAFTEAGGLDTPAGIAKWNGSSWSHLDIRLPASIIYSIIASNADPVSGDYDLHVGTSQTGNAEIAGTATVTNNGSSAAYPRFVIERSGGTEATLQTIRNGITNEELLFNYSLLDGETLTIDLRPKKRSIVSSFFGPQMDALLLGSDFGTFNLLPDANEITCFVYETGAPTVYATVIWQNTYDGLD